MGPSIPPTAEEPYLCSICSRRLQTPESLARHIRTSHEKLVAWNCAAFADHNLAFEIPHPVDSPRTGETLVATCIFCRDTFSGIVTPAVQENHLLHVHRIGQCNLDRVFYRFDKFKQHLKHYHRVKLPPGTQPWRDIFLLQASNSTAGADRPSGQTSSRPDPAA